MKRFFIGGNWKMNGDLELIESFSKSLIGATSENLQLVLFPPAPLLSSAKSSLSVPIGAQNCYKSAAGAFTGEVSPRLLASMGIEWVLLGHSERRTIFGESDSLIAGKVEAALKEGLKVVLCVGETLAEREAGVTESVLQSQLEQAIGEADISAASDFIIAYEPVWAIGTGKVASPAQVQAAHSFIRSRLGKLKRVKIIYGGSVNAGSAGELAQLPDVDGFLIGGASLLVEELNKIIELVQGVVKE